MTNLTEKYVSVYEMYLNHIRSTEQHTKNRWNLYVTVSEIPEKEVSVSKLYIKTTSGALNCIPNTIAIPHPLQFTHAPPLHRTNIALKRAINSIYALLEYIHRVEAFVSSF